ncbi:hypothetical protein KIL84_008457 [Mauremys mutica]|uniref:Uncharacterized protein n=1 Tax=Mauremys mutica TaxID=74926 RepID=A0A9D3X727_9SAUR|nr:hypothetical protein KIL84_008457 [Mauremys mutica]
MENGGPDRLLLKGPARWDGYANKKQMQHPGETMEDPPVTVRGNGTWVSFRGPAKAPTLSFDGDMPPSTFHLGPHTRTELCGDVRVAEKTGAMSSGSLSSQIRTPAAAA